MTKHLRRLVDQIVEGAWRALIFCSVIVLLFFALAIWVMLHPEQTQQQRWEEMCSGPARYDAMREAADKGKPNPC